MWWLLAATVVVIVAAGVREVRALRSCGVGKVQRGRHADLTTDLPRPDVAVAHELVAAALPSSARASKEGLGAHAGHARSAGLDAAFVGSLAAGTGLVDWFRVDPELLEAVEHWTHTSVDNGLDLWRTVHERDYQFLSAGFERSLRGHAGEQEVEAQLSAWASDVHMPWASNHRGFDLQLDGHAANVKVGQDASAVRDHLKDNPDIPVIVNADMTGVPDDAIRLDLTQPFDPDLLSDHSVIVADGLQLSDLQDAMADAFGPSLDSYDAGDLFDNAGNLAVPGLGWALRVVRSGMRENKLREIHGDDGRALRNIGTDAVVFGGGATGGGALGLGLGAIIDIASGGTTVGFGTTVIGPAIGTFIGGWLGSKKATELRMRPLTGARATTTQAVREYDESVRAATEVAMTTWATSVVPRYEARAQQHAVGLKSTSSAVTARAGRELTQAAEEDGAELQSLLAQASIVVDDRARRLRGHWLAQRRICSWRAAASSTTGTSTGADLDVLAAAPDGSALVRAHLTVGARRRAAILASAGVAAARLERQAQDERQAALRDLAAERDLLQDRVLDAVQPQLAAIEASTAGVRRELVATGATTQEWVDEHLPTPGLPTPRQSEHAGRPLA